MLQGDACAEGCVEVDGCDGGCGAEGKLWDAYGTVAARGHGLRKLRIEQDGDGCGAAKELAFVHKSQSRIGGGWGDEGQDITAAVIVQVF